MKLNQEIKKGQWADEIETVDTENFVGHNQLHQEQELRIDKKA